MSDSFLSRFTPSLMTHEALEAVFVQREKLASRIVEVVRESAVTPSKHHVLLVGPRGIGKTHLISIAYHRLRAMDDLRDRLLIAWMREEEWGVASFLDLLLRIFRALEKELDRNYASRVESLFQHSPEEAERIAAGLLREIVGNRTLLVLAENLDDLFCGLGEHGQKQLRAYMQENPFMAIVATAQSLFNGVSRQTSPFYGTFAIHHLEGLGHEDAVAMLRKMAEFVEDRELASFVRTPAGRNRIRAVGHLAGGNHRVYAIFSQFLTRDSLDRLVGPLVSTIDDLTAYYQSRMAHLPPQQRKIVEFLCDRRGAVSVKEIAERCFLKHQGVSSQLVQLREKGYVTSTTVGRDSYYELREPLMRLCVEVKKHRGEPIRLLVDFLRLWYTREELEGRMATLSPQASLEREYVSRAIELSGDETADPRIQASLADFLKCQQAGDYEEALKVAQELVAVRGSAEDWWIKGMCLHELSRWKDALESYDRALERKPKIAGGFRIRGVVLLNLRRYEDALESFDKAVELDPKEASTWHSRGVALGNLERYEEALESYCKALKFDPKDALAWHNRGSALVKSNRHKEALESYDKALELDPKEASTWHDRGVALGHLKRYEEALGSYDKALELDPKYALAWSSRAWCLCLLNRYQEMLESCEKAINLRPRLAHAHFNRAVALFALNRWDEGLNQLGEAFKLPGCPEVVDAEDAEAITRNLLAHTTAPSEWRLRARSLFDLFHERNTLSVLAQGLARSISALGSPMIANAAAREWFAAWKDVAGDSPEFQIPLRLLGTAVQYRENPDPRVLLNLAVEEREILKQALGLD